MIRLTILVAAVLAHPSASPAQTAPNTGVIVHGLVYFASGSAEPLAPGPIDPIKHLAPRVWPTAHVLVSGYADTLGSREANKLLSLARARAVADRLVSLGVKPQSITLESCGEANLAKPTADEVSEPLNRRVYFDWQLGPYQDRNRCEMQPYQQR
ncbi:OmpA family protein [Brevundimonas sp. 1080]|uniref:OmpA family protein n=1 Tax=Brevundimonas sp. 1080 TaxID=3156405 RepID=UPI00339729F1